MREYIETVINGLKTTWLSMLSKVEELARQAKAAADEAQDVADSARDTASHISDTANSALTIANQASSTANSAADIASSRASVNNPQFFGTFSQNRKANTVQAAYSHAEGYEATASQTASHAEGNGTIASGKHSHAEGDRTKASGQDSHAEGLNTIASGSCSHVQGKYNIEDVAAKYAHIVGNGVSKRSNAHTLDWNGVAWYQGRPQFGGTAQDDGSQTVMANGDTEITLKSSGGKEFKITVSDDGVLSATEVTST